jgi:predicted metalloendopeptidase
MKTYKALVKKNIGNKTRKIYDNVKKYKVRPQDDFYSHINYSLIKKEYHSKNKDRTFDLVIKKKVNHELENIILPKLLEEKTHSGEQIRNICKASMHWNDDIANKKIKDFVEKIRDYMSNSKSVYDFMGWFVREGFNFPIGWNIEIDAQKTHEYISHLTENGITFMNKESYFSNNKKYKNLRKMYSAFLKNIFDICFGKENKYNVKQIFEIEKNISENLLSYKDDLYIKNTFNVFSQEKCFEETGLDWHKFSKALGFKFIQKNVIIENPKYVKRVMDLLKTWNSESWETFWVYQVIVVASQYHKKLFIEFSNFFNKVYETPSQKTIDMKKIALLNVETYMNATISKKYIELFKNEKEIVYTKNLVERYKRVFKKRLGENPWLHSDTKKKSSKKLENMIIITGCKEQWENDPNIIYSSTDPWENYMLFTRWSLTRDIESIGKRMPSKNVWIQTEDQNVYDVNAYYNSLENELVFPNAILQPPFVDVDKDFIYNLASIGATIGHEMIHAFDDDGYYYDENGIYVKDGWWNENDKKEYELKQQKIINLYETAAKADKLKIDGGLTLSENIADLGGFLLTEEVLVDYLNEKEIYGDRQDKYLKELYIHYAVNWRSSQSIKVFKRSLQDNAHSYAKYRVNCALSNSKNFQRIFNVKQRDKMYFIPEEIW